jgi:hypothetical protein
MKNNQKEYEKSLEINKHHDEDMHNRNHKEIVNSKSHSKQDNREKSKMKT